MQVQFIGAETWEGRRRGTAGNPKTTRKHFYALANGSRKFGPMGKRSREIKWKWKLAGWKDKMGCGGLGARKSNEENC